MAGGDIETETGGDLSILQAFISFMPGFQTPGTRSCSQRSTFHSHLQSFWQPSTQPSFPCLPLSTLKLGQR